MAKFSRSVLPETRKRCEQGDMQAQFDLGLFYWEGRGLKKDKSEAKALWLALAKRGHVRAMFMLGLALTQEGRVREALELFQRAAADNDADAMYHAGVLCYEGTVNGMPEYDDALNWFKKADSHNHRHACKYLAHMFLHGKGAPRNAGLSASYYTKCANAGHIEGQYRLGLFYLLGIGVPKDYLAAKKWLERAARRDHLTAQYVLGLMYFRGIGVEQDYTRSRLLFEKAACLDSLIENPKIYCYTFILTPWRDSVPDALCKLCEMNANGWGKQCSMKEASKMYTLAVERDERKARACFMRLSVEQRDEIMKILREEAGAREANAYRARELRHKRHSIRKPTLRPDYKV